MLAIKDLTIHYGTFKIIENVSLNVVPGEVVALIGPNGAGKTTLIRGVSGISPITAGTIEYEGVDLEQLSAPKRARIMAVVPQVSFVGGAFTVEQVIMMGRTTYMSWLGKPKQDDIAHVEHAMRQTNTKVLAHRRIAELSGGEQQRVMLARALAQDTPLLVLDEPTNHLDLQHQGEILSLVREQAKTNDLAVLMVLHDLNLVSLFADKAALMVDGQIISFGAPQEVLVAETIQQAYHTEVDIIHHPKTNNPIILNKMTQGRS